VFYKFIQLVLGVDRFVNFGHSIDPGGKVVIFAKKQEKIWIKNYYLLFKKRGKNLVVGQKYEINYA